jgi:hypothetical protein
LILGGSGIALSRLFCTPLLADLETQGKQQGHESDKPDDRDGDQTGRHVETVVHCRNDLWVVNENKGSRHHDSELPRKVDRDHATPHAHQL